jgi:hypothetical protein
MKTRAMIWPPSRVSPEKCEKRGEEMRKHEMN